MIKIAFLKIIKFLKSVFYRIEPLFFKLSPMKPLCACSNLFQIFKTEKLNNSGPNQNSSTAIKRE